MKKLFLIVLAILLLAAPALALDWTNANQITVAWENNPANINMPPIEIFKTRLFIVNSSDTAKANPIEVGLVEPDITQFVITIPAVGKYYVGARVVCFYDGTEENSSEFIWSDNPLDVADGATFGVKYMRTPGKPGALRIP